MKLARSLLMTCAFLTLTACASLTKFRDKPDASEFCLEEALKVCPELSKPGATEFDTAVAWGTEYALCQKQHEILAHCVQEH